MSSKRGNPLLWVQKWWKCRIPSHPETALSSHALHGTAADQAYTSFMLFHKSKLHFLQCLSLPNTLWFQTRHVSLLQWTVNLSMAWILIDLDISFPINYLAYIDVVASSFKNKIRYAPYVSLESQISHIAINKGNIKRQCSIYNVHSIKYITLDSKQRKDNSDLRVKTPI